MTRLLTLIVAVVLISGCAARTRCAGDAEYQQAVTLSPPAGVDGLKMPESASALRIPPPPPAAAPLPEGQCLETPPRMAEVPADKAPEKAPEAAKQAQP